MPDLTGAQPGDIAIIRAKVIRASPAADVGLLIEMRSKTDQYQAWVRPSMVVEVRPKPLPEEPPVGGVASVLRASGASDPLPRWRQLWERYADGWHAIGALDDPATWEELHAFGQVKVLVEMEPEDAANYG